MGATTDTRAGDPTYTMGRTGAETERLIRQAGLYDRSTRRLLEDAGLGPGMRVLDVGSGAGDVALLAAGLVGPEGAVLGVDVNPDVLATARRRARAAGYRNVTFQEGDFRTAALPGDLDAVVGRLVLMYVGDPEAALRALVRRVRPGGIVAFQELDLTIPYAWAVAGFASPLGQRYWTWAFEAFQRSGAHVAMGRDLYRLFVAAGLEAPELTLHAPLGGPADWPGHEYVAETWRSLVPLVERFGIATAAEVGVETLAERTRAEVASRGEPLLLTPLVGAWGRTPRPGAM
jgi:ubiquinone/menaquinone biosynthesis C-methylase UbiE